jgi:hypothetical protein
MEYIVGNNADKRPAVDGIILQAPVSDREALHKEAPQAFMNEADQLALRMCREGKDQDALPNRLTHGAGFGRIAITARRWVDIASPGPYHDGKDDYFSSDLPEERLRGTFGKLPASAPLLILYSGADASVPESVDKRRLVQQWMHVTEDGGGVVDAVNGGIVEGASHNLNNQAEQIVSIVLVWAARLGLTFYTSGARPRASRGRVRRTIGERRAWCSCRRFKDLGVQQSASRHEQRRVSSHTRHCHSRQKPDSHKLDGPASKHLSRRIYDPVKYRDGQHKPDGSAIMRWRQRTSSHADRDSHHGLDGARAFNTGKLTKH